MNKKIVIAGGTGFIGKSISDKFIAEGYHVIIISRSSDHISWNDANGIKEALESADLLINLAGKSVDCRHTEKNKSEILNSRVQTTSALGKTLINCENPPGLWINASGANIYPDNSLEPATESSPLSGNGFIAEVSRKWEEEFYSHPLYKTRRVSLRLSVVLGSNGGVLIPLKNLVNFRLGGTQGKGDQKFSWIHMEDLYLIFRFLQAHSEISGPVNCTSPYTVSNKELMQCLRKVLNVNIGIPSPELLIKLGAFFIGTESDLILRGTWTIPQKLLDAGYKFRYPELESALRNILNQS